VLGFGDTARVVEPADLVERVKGELERALANYNKKRPTPAGPPSSARPVSTQTP
jgi:hypothetical protein